MISTSNDNQKRYMEIFKHNKTKIIMIVAFFSLVTVVGQLSYTQVAIGQVNEESQNQANVSNNPSEIQSTQNTTQQAINDVVKPDAQILVLAEDLFEIRDNLAEARESLIRGHLFELAESIDNLDHLVTVLINPLPENVTAFEQNNPQLQQQSMINSEQ